MEVGWDDALRIDMAIEALRVRVEFIIKGEGASSSSELFQPSPFVNPTPSRSISLPYVRVFVARCVGGPSSDSLASSHRDRATVIGGPYCGAREDPDVA